MSTAPWQLFIKSLVSNAFPSEPVVTNTVIKKLFPNFRSSSRSSWYDVAFDCIDIIKEKGTVSASVPQLNMGNESKPKIIYETTSVSQDTISDVDDIESIKEEYIETVTCLNPELDSDDYRVAREFMVNYEDIDPLDEKRLLKEMVADQYMNIVKWMRVNMFKLVIDNKNGRSEKTYPSHWHDIRGERISYPCELEGIEFVMVFDIHRNYEVEHNIPKGFYKLSLNTSLRFKVDGKKYRTMFSKLSSNNRQINEFLDECFINPRDRDLTGKPIGVINDYKLITEKRESVLTNQKKRHIELAKKEQARYSRRSLEKKLAS